MSSTIMSPAIQTQQYNNNSSYVPTHAANTRTYYQAAPQVQPYSNGRISGNNNFANGGGVNMASYNSHRTPYGVTRDGTPLQDSVPLSTTNLYIRGLSPDMRDEDLRQMCERYGNIVSTKAIMDKASNQCKGYGFVDFEKSEEAARAVEDLNQRHIQAQMAKQQEQDPTNLYIANLPINYTEQMLEGVLSKFGLVISTRILRNADGQSRGVGFARMDSKEKCEEIISNLNGKHLEDMTPAQPALLVKQADSGRKSARKRSDINFDMSLFQPQQFGVHPDYMRMQPQMYAAPPYYNIGYQPMQPAYNGGFDVNAVATQMGHMNLGAAVTQPQGDSAPYYLYQQQGQQQQQFYRRPTYATGYEVGQANNNVNAAMVPSTYTNSSEDHEQYRTVHTGQFQAQ